MPSLSISRARKDGSGQSRVGSEGWGEYCTETPANWGLPSLAIPHSLQGDSQSAELTFAPVAPPAYLLSICRSAVKIASPGYLGLKAYEGAL